MVKKVLIGLLTICVCFVSLTGCDDADQTQSGCNSSNYDYAADQIEFELPSSDLIDKYVVEIEAASTGENLGVQEGLPGETIIFELDRPMVYVNATLTAYDAAGEVMDVAEFAVVDVDVMNKICEVTVDTVAEIDAENTAVDVNVKCFGREFADVHIPGND